MGVLVFFGAQFVMKVGLFAEPGEVIYDESLSDEEIAKLNTVFGDQELKLKKDVTISVRNELTLPE